MEFGNPTLGEISRFTFKMLGSFCEDDLGYDSKLRKDFESETNKQVFGKYNLHNGELGCLLKRFRNSVESFVELSPIGNFFTTLPKLLQRSIANFVCDEKFFHPKKENIKIILSIYIAYCIYIDILSPSEIEKCMEAKYSDSLNDIKNLQMDFGNLSEKSKWSTVKQYLRDVKNYVKDEEVSRTIMQNILEHYLFTGFKTGLSTVFSISEDEANEVFLLATKNFRSIISYLNFMEDNACFPTDGFNVFDVICSSVQDRSMSADFHYHPRPFPSDFAISIKIDKRISCILESTNYFVNSFARIKDSEAEDYLTRLDSFGNDSVSSFFKGWMKARKMIFSLRFDGSKEDDEIKEEALELFKNIFDSYKYFMGRNVREFLSDAIITDVYFNRKKTTDILENTQDDSSESSILKPGKTYWEFGYAIGVFSEDSKHTYLVNFNAERNFWTNFPVSKFTCIDNPLRRYEEEMVDEELELPSIVQELSEKKFENLLSKENKKTRFKLKKRYYTNLSLAIMNYETEKDFTLIRNYIKAMDNETITKNDESGATPLVRALNEYRNCVYGFEKNYLQERGNILKKFNYSSTTDFYKLVMQSDEKLWFDDKRLMDLQDQLMEQRLNIFGPEYIRNYNSLVESFRWSKNSLVQRASRLKEYVIYPLIEKMKNHFLDDAIQIDSRNCVNALQLAIDSYDFEIVKMITEKLISGGMDLSKIFISEERVTPLQYAVRKYDLFMQFDENVNHNKPAEPLNYKKVPMRKDVFKGILPEDREYYKSPIQQFLRIFSFEECGCPWMIKELREERNIQSLQQKNLFDIVEYLATKTSTISAETLLYIADMQDEDGSMYNDTLELARKILSTGNVDLMQKSLDPGCGNEDTILSKIFRTKNYALLDLLIDEYPEVLKPILNKKIFGIGNSPSDFRYETDMHMFVLNQIENAKLWNSTKDKDKDKEKYLEWIIKCNMTRLQKFKTMGADFEIPDQDGQTVKDLLNKWKTKFPANSIPEEMI